MATLLAISSSIDSEWQNNHIFLMASSSRFSLFVSNILYVWSLILLKQLDKTIAPDFYVVIVDSCFALIRFSQFGLRRDMKNYLGLSWFYPHQRSAFAHNTNLVLDNYL